MQSIEHGYLMAPTNLPLRATGAIPSPRHVLAAAAPHAVFGDTPAQWWWLPETLSYWLNSVDGDCVTASEAFARACSGILIQDATVQEWATQHGVLNGAVISDVLDWMVQQGFSQDGNVYGAGSKVAVDYTNDAALQNAISKGPVKIGVAAAQLQRAVGTKNGWFAPGFRKDTNYDHCVELCGYGTVGALAQALKVTVPAGISPTAQGYALFTWETIGVIGPQSMRNITCEAWLRTPTTVTRGTNPVPPDRVVTPVPPTPVPPNPIPPTPGRKTFSFGYDPSTGATTPVTVV